MVDPIPDPISDNPISDASLRCFSGYALKRAFNTVQADVNATLAPLGLRMLSFSALTVIAGNPGLRQSQLAAALSIERPNLVIVLDDLEQRGLVSRDRIATDRRAYALRLTTDGEQLYDQAKEAVQAHEARMTQALTPAQRLTMIDLLHRIETVNIKEHPDE
jgi:DNA-binding MarR family transcriptional regulator